MVQRKEEGRGLMSGGRGLATGNPSSRPGAGAQHTDAVRAVRAPGTNDGARRGGSVRAARPPIKLWDPRRGARAVWARALGGFSALRGGISRGFLVSTSQPGWVHHRSQRAPPEAALRPCGLAA